MAGTARDQAPNDKWHWCVVFNGGHIYTVSDTFESAETCMADAACAGLDALHGAEMCLTPKYGPDNPPRLRKPGELVAASGGPTVGPN